MAAHLTSGDRILLDLLTEQNSNIMEKLGALDEVKAGIADLPNQLTEAVKKAVPSNPANMVGNVDTEAIDAAIWGEVRKFKKRRFIQDDSLVEDVRSFSQRLDDGLNQGSSLARAEGFREIAIILARDELVDDAELALNKASSLCDIDVTPERARILILRKDYESALQLLRQRNDTSSISLFIQTISHRDGVKEAISYFSKNHKAEELTGHALHWLSLRMSEVGDLKRAKTLLNLATDEQIEENPLILFERGRLCMANAMAPDVAQRFLSTHGLIPNPNDYHTDVAGQNLLDEAVVDFEALVEPAKELSANDLLAILDVQILALKLSAQDQTKRTQAESELKVRLEDPNEAIELAPLALLHGVKFDWTGLKQQLENAERFGGLDSRQLRAAFSLTMREDNPTRIAAFIAKHEKALRATIGEHEIIGIQIEALAKSNSVDDAMQLLEDHRNTLGESFCAFLKTTIEEYQGADSVTARLKQFELSDKTHDLEILISALSKAKDVRLGDYLTSLWTRKHQLDDAARACDAFMLSNQTDQLNTFLDSVTEYIPEHPHLRMHLAWRLQRQGELSKALTELDAMSAADIDNHNLRQLRVSILIELGRWTELEPFLQGELNAQADRSAHTLMSAAQLACAIESSSALPLARAALLKDGTTPELSLAAYGIALQLGGERNEEVNTWLKVAIDGSNENGPMFTRDIEDAVEFMREARERQENLNAMIMSAELPLSLAAKPLNVSLSSIFIGQAWENRQQDDPRKHNPIPAYAGNRLFWDLPEDPVISFDITSLLTLQITGLLAKVLTSFRHVVLPAGTLSQLFEDNSRARHTQPSRVHQARETKRLIASTVLAVEACETGSSELEAQVGSEFARLFNSAVNQDGFVVDTAPLHPPGKLKETVDATPFKDRLVSPTGLIRTLQKTGTLSATVCSDALKAIAGSGEGWSTEAELEQNKPLFLSMVAAQYFIDAGIMQRLKGVFGKLVILPDVEAAANHEIAEDARAQEVCGQIGLLRETIAQNIEGGSITIGRLVNEQASDNEDVETRREVGPLFNALMDTSGADIFVCDDRGLNKNGQFIDKSDNSIPVAISFDILRHLKAKKLITKFEYESALEKIRESGLSLVPVDFEEIASAVCNSNWDVGPNATLRQIRNSIHLPLIRGLIKLPEERYWLRTSILSIALAVRRAWADISNPTHAQRAATYLYGMIPDIRKYGQTDESTDRDLWIQEVSRSTLLLVEATLLLPDEHIEKYQNWFDNYVAPIESQRDPGALEAVAKMLLEQFSKPIDLEALDAEE